MKTSRTIGIALFLLLSTLVYAGDRSYIRQQIQSHNECRNVAITEYSGNLMLYGRNGWAGTGLPQGLTTALNELNSDKEYIDDVQITEGGSWLILYGNNGFRWNEIPYSLERKIREWNSTNEIITSVTFNDAGDWIAVSQNYISASSQWIQDWLANGCDRYGQLWAVCVTGDAMVAVYESGYKFYGNVPQSLQDALNTETRNVYRLKIAGTSWFYADKYGSYRYYM